MFTTSFIRLLFLTFIHLAFVYTPFSAQGIPTQEKSLSLIKHAKKVAGFFLAEAEIPQTLKGLNTYAQTNFLRPKGLERQDLKTIAHYVQFLSSLNGDQEKALLKVFADNGQLEDVTPQNSSPDIILIMGSTMPTMRSALAYVNEMVQGRTLKLKSDTQIVFLTGDRPLFSSETKDIVMNTAPYTQNSDWAQPKEMPTNETDLGPLLWNQLELVPDLRNAYPVYMRSEKKDGTARATTADTVIAYVNVHTPAQDANVLVISSNPFIDYQVLVTKTHLRAAGRKDLKVEGAGRSLYNSNQPISLILGILLDNHARTIYQKLQLQKMS